MAKNIEDFGQKIGGAKKDLWKSRGLDLSDITEFNDAERDKFIVKNNIWLKPDYEKMYKEEGYSREAVFFIKSVRDAIPTKPELGYHTDQETINQRQEDYIDFVQKLKEELLTVKTTADIDKVGLKFFDENDYAHKNGYSWSVTESGKAAISNKLFKTIQMKPLEAMRKALEKEFLYTQEELLRLRINVKDMNSPDLSFDDGYTNSQNRVCIREKVYGGTKFYYVREDEINNKEAFKEKPHFVAVDNNIIFAAKTKEEAELFVEAFVNKTLGKIEEKQQEMKQAASDEKAKRKTSLVPKQLEHIQRIGQPVRNKEIEGQDFIDTFKIKGGEFGNWLNEKDRQANMNFAYESFKDLAKALNMEDKDISLDGRLNIAFGARGSGNALAHYEPLREVINLTKMKGAGSLAHEYFHAIDDIVGKMQGGKDFATERRGVWSVFDNLVDAMKYKVATDEQIMAQRQERYDKAVNDFMGTMERMIPDDSLSDELKAEKASIIKELMDKTKEKDFTFTDHDFTRKGVKSSPSPVINKLAAFIDANSSRYKMDNHNKLAVCSRLDSIASAQVWLKEPIDHERPVKVETEFYKDAKAIDAAYSKSGHDYWKSNKEMAARAFACYIQDKLAEQGMRNDYLCGHAETAPAFVGEGKFAYTYPRGEERAAINQAFDKVIAELKTRGIINEKKQSLDDVIKAASGKTVDTPSTPSLSRDKTI